MKNSVFFKLTFTLFLFLTTITSCSSDTNEVIGVEISDTSSLNGTYILDKSYTKGPKYVNTENSSKRLITYNDDGIEMWGLMNYNYLVYKIARDKETPPEANWQCGIGVDKDKFKCILIYND